MKNWKKALALVLAIISVLSLVACGEKPADTPAPDATPEEVTVDANGIPEGLTLTTTTDGTAYYDAKYTGYNGGSYEFSIGHGSSVDGKVDKSAIYFANNVAIRSNGKIKVTIYPANQLGDDREMSESTALGNLDGSLIGTGVVAGFADALNFCNLPWIIKDWDDFAAFYDGEGGAYMNEQLSANTDMCIGGWGITGVRQQLSAEKQLKTPADMKGMKTRCQQNTIHTAIFNGIGAVAVPMASVEIYTALQQGTIQGLDQVIYLAREKRHDEVAKYWTILNWGYDPLLFLVNEAKLDSFDAEARAIMEEEMVKWGVFDRSLEDTYDAECLEAMIAEGAQVYYPTEAELQQWKDAERAAAYPVFKDLVGEEVYNKLMGMCDTEW